MASVEVQKDGIIDYPLYEGQSLGVIWDIERNPQGPIVTPKNGYLDYTVTNLQTVNQRTSVTINTLLPTNGGSFLVFRARASIVQNTNEIKLTLPADVILRFDRSRFNYQWWDGSFHTLAQSNIRPNDTGKWNDIVFAFSPTSVSVWENGIYMFSWMKSVGEKVKPVFHMQILDVGGNLSFQIGRIFSIPPFFLDGVNTPWDFAFSKSSLPDPSTVTISEKPDKPFKVSFEDTFMRISAQPLQQFNQWINVDLTPKLPTYSVTTYRFRFNESGGRESKIHFIGNNILRITDNGQTSQWQYFGSDLQFHTLASSEIKPSGYKGEFFLVTIITTENCVSLLENGMYKFTRNYDPVDHWDAKFWVQHLDVNTNLSVDLSGVRTLPSIKPSTLLPKDLQLVMGTFI